MCASSCFLCFDRQVLFMILLADGILLNWIVQMPLPSLPRSPKEPLHSMYVEDFRCWSRIVFHVQTLISLVCCFPFYLLQFNAYFRGWQMGHYVVRWRVKLLKDYYISNGLRFRVSVNYDVSLAFHRVLACFAAQTNPSFSHLISELAFNMSLGRGRCYGLSGRCHFTRGAPENRYDRDVISRSCWINNPHNGY